MLDGKLLKLLGPPHFTPSVAGYIPIRRVSNRKNWGLGVPPIEETHLHVQLSNEVPSGRPTCSHLSWIMDSAIKRRDFPQFCERLPKGLYSTSHPRGLQDCDMELCHLLPVQFGLPAWSAGHLHHSNPNKIQYTYYTSVVDTLNCPGSVSLCWFVTLSRWLERHLGMREPLSNLPACANTCGQSGGGNSELRDR